MTLRKKRGVVIHVRGEGLSHCRPCLPQGTPFEGFQRERGRERAGERQHSLRNDTHAIATDSEILFGPTHASLFGHFIWHISWQPCTA